MPLIPSKTLIASAEIPAGPPTATLRPPWSRVTRSRYASTGSRMSFASPVAPSELATSAVDPSEESWNGVSASGPVGLPNGVAFLNC